MIKDLSKLPRIYHDENLTAEWLISLGEGPAHYFRSVLRRQAGDEFRVFNGRDGEWLAELTTLGKRNALAKIKTCIKPQPEKPNAVHLFFSPIKKQRLNILIEKAVELGVTDLHPVLCARTENRKINAERTEAQIIEALEQCERMHRPRLHDLIDLKAITKNTSAPKPIYACLERHEAQGIESLSGQIFSFLVGPEGGFDPQEIEFLCAQEHIKPLSLGETVYRAETACIICLVQANYGT